MAAQGGVTLADAVQKIEVLELGERLRLGDALGERGSGHDGLNGSKRVAARLFGVDQNLADGP
ncbi:hypothetical protein [Polaromonas sp.]|uniref:hypothetical protein n=1 Tax=Polaromonas sp. TaxID=1869339 RepID=UPI0025E927F8|nr:hypothetical protein [Polaromonas sp.]